MSDGFGLTRAQVADRIGVTRSYTTNRLRLLTLASHVQAMVRDGRIRHAMAKTLGGLPGDQQQSLATRAGGNDWLLRQFDREIRKTGQGGNAGDSGKDHETARLEQRLSEHVGSPATIEAKSNGGYKLDVDTPNLDVLEGVLEKLGFNNNRVE